MTISKSVTRIEPYAFQSCTNLATAVFESAPPEMGQGVFDKTSDNFTVYYQASATGFTSPTWTDSSGDSYPAIASSPQDGMTTQVAANAPAPTSSDTTSTLSDASGQKEQLKMLKENFDQGLIPKEIYDQKVSEIRGANAATPVAAALASIEGKSLKTEHTGAVLCVAYSPDGKRLASASRDKSIRLWAIPSK